MSIGKIYGATGNGRFNRALVTAKLSGLVLDSIPDFKFGIDNKIPEFLSKFPLGQTPAFEGSDGILLTESNAIVFHIASQKENNPLLGANKNEYSKIFQYPFYIETQIIPQVYTLLLPILGIQPYDANAETAAYSHIDRALNFLDNELKGKKYLVGDKLTAADIIIFFGADVIYSRFYAKEHRDQYPTLTNTLNLFLRFLSLKSWLVSSIMPKNVPNTLLRLKFLSNTLFTIKYFKYKLRILWWIKIMILNLI